MIRARFRLELPEHLWIATLSRSFPDATFRLLTGVPMGERSLELGEVLTERPEAVAAAMADNPDIVAYEQLYLGQERVLAKYETTEQALFELLGGTSLLPEFPLQVENGRMTVTITATRAQFEAFGAALEEMDGQYELLSVVHSQRESSVVTERQRECLETAQRLGYFEVPRESTLAEVAEELGVDKSTASETLRRGSARVLDWFFVSRTR